MDKELDTDSLLELQVQTVEMLIECCDRSIANGKQFMARTAFTFVFMAVLVALEVYISVDGDFDLATVFVVGIVLFVMVDMIKNTRKAMVEIKEWRLRKVCYKNELEYLEARTDKAISDDG